MTIWRRLWRRHETETRIQLRRFVHVAIPRCAGAPLAASFVVEGVLQPLAGHRRESCAYGVSDGPMRWLRPRLSAGDAACELKHGGERAAADLDYSKSAACTHIDGGGVHWPQCFR